MTSSAVLTPEEVVATLRTLVAQLRQAGIRHLGQFGSLARGEAGAGSITR